ncbi:DNA replication/repair protein RecF [Oribacterium sp. WCC10]|uniref:DNA replication/repair protein RecF n=1 Tax=Oribacterium sp. WCC10 TaxID=1855343 RepID=UPI0008E9C17C|nr:DNA replication/repair protein RecF [Oribacterium sp. WCC10]SFG72395.1 DNA replication and repair protein RecF [Oribacterium sp. WCC10]
MIIESLELKNFRNYQSLKVNMSSGTNIFFGDNAQGKTNVLESIFLASTSKSYRIARDKDLIQFGNDEAHIKMEVRKRGVPYRIDMHLKKNKSKGIAIDEIPIHKASELFGIANIVSFSPEDLGLIKDGPAIRRRFMDLELCQLDKVYLYNLTRYNKTLNQRNKLLKDIKYKPSLMDTLSVWDDELTKYGLKIIEIRKKFIDELKDIIIGIHHQLTGGVEQLKIKYNANVSEEDFHDTLLRIRDSELKQQITLAGPHRDDIQFLINDKDIRKFGSQGQQRSAALALKLSEIELVRNKIDDDPILLLDDVLSELDSKRQNYLLNILSNTQNIITCTGLDDFVNNRFHIDELFHVVNGTVTKIDDRSKILL